MIVRLLLAVLFICASLNAQRRVDSRNMYQRVLAVVPMVGSGTLSDPMRPEYAPIPAASALTQSSANAPISPSDPTPNLRQGIIAFSYVVSDDGKSALAEFVAVDLSAFKDLLADTTVKSFLKGRDSIADAVSAFQNYKQNFTLDQLGSIVP